MLKVIAPAALVALVAANDNGLAITYVCRILACGTP